MRKGLLLALLSGLLFFQNCTNSTDETPTPVVITAEDFQATIDENPSAGDVIGTINASVSEGVLSFELAEENPENAIAVSDLGQLTVNDPLLYDFEVNPQITATINVSSAGVTEIVSVIINLNDLAEEGDGLTFNNFTADFDENPSNGDEIGTLSASSTVGTVSYSLIFQSPEGAIQVNENTGVIQVADASLFVFATNPTITASVEVTDGEDTGTISVTINLIEPLTIWTGTKITFTKADGADPNVEANQDRITDNVWISRGNDGGPIINVQSSANNDDGPGDTEWALGTTDQIADLEFSSLREALGGGRSVFRNSVGKDLVLHLITDDIYIDLTFTQWSSGEEGGFAYERSTDPN